MSNSLNDLVDYCLHPAINLEPENASNILNYSAALRVLADESYGMEQISSFTLDMNLANGTAALTREQHYFTGYCFPLLYNTLRPWCPISDEVIGKPSLVIGQILLEPLRIEAAAIKVIKN